jgi:hypothetical protein
MKLITEGEGSAACVSSAVRHPGSGWVSGISIWKIPRLRFLASGSFRNYQIDSN